MISWYYLSYSVWTSDSEVTKPEAAKSTELIQTDCFIEEILSDPIGQ